MSLSGGTQTVPALYALPSTAFHKVAITSSGGSNQAINTASYNTQTGLGTPNGSVLIGDLVGVGTSASAPTSPTSTPSAPSSPPAIPEPPPFTIPTPIPIPVSNPVTVPPKVLAPPPTFAPPAGAAPATPAPASPPVALSVPKKVRKAAPPKKLHKSGRLVSRPKSIGKRHVTVKPRSEARADHAGIEPASETL